MQIQHTKISKTVTFFWIYGIFLHSLRRLNFVLITYNGKMGLSLGFSPWLPPQRVRNRLSAGEGRHWTPERGKPGFQPRECAVERGSGRDPHPPSLAPALLLRALATFPRRLHRRGIRTSTPAAARGPGRQQLREQGWSPWPSPFSPLPAQATPPHARAAATCHPHGSGEAGGDTRQQHPTPILRDCANRLPACNPSLPPLAPLDSCCCLT